MIGKKKDPNLPKNLDPDPQPCMFKIQEGNDWFFFVDELIINVL